MVKGCSAQSFAVGREQGLPAGWPTPGMGAACPSRGITKQAEHSFALSVVDSASESFETQQFRLPSPVPVGEWFETRLRAPGGRERKRKGEKGERGKQRLLSTKLCPIGGWGSLPKDRALTLCRDNKNQAVGSSLHGSAVINPTSIQGHRFNPWLRLVG